MTKASTNKPSANGVFLTSESEPAIKRGARSEGLTLVHVDMSKVATKAALLEKFGRAFSAPSYFGKNWDALNDCLTDLSWLDAPGWLLIVSGSADFERKHPKDFATLLELLAGAAAYWTSQHRTFRVMVPVTERSKPR